MTEVSVKIKLWSLIAIMLLFIVGVGAVGYATLNRGENTLKTLVNKDEAFLNFPDQLHLKIIQLRRFEKDYFLNIGDAAKQQAYLKKYETIDAAVPGLINNLANLARGDVQLSKDLKAKVMALKGHYDSYREGFYDTIQKVDADPNLTPQQANLLMTRYKANIPILEEDMVTVAQDASQMAARVSARALARGRQAQTIIVVAALIAVVLAGALGSALCTSIYRAIFREGLRRMAHRI
jgi:methyl-accepting chemotaxis protein